MIMHPLANLGLALRLEQAAGRVLDEAQKTQDQRAQGELARLAVVLYRHCEYLRAQACGTPEPEQRPMPH